MQRRIPDQLPEEGLSAPIAEWAHLIETIDAEVVDDADPDTLQAATQRLEDWVATARQAVNDYWQLDLNRLYGDVAVYNRQLKDACRIRHQMEHDVAPSPEGYDSDQLALISKTAKPFMRLDVDTWFNQLTVPMPVKLYLLDDAIEQIGGIVDSSWSEIGRVRSQVDNLICHSQKIRQRAIALLGSTIADSR